MRRSRAVANTAAVLIAVLVAFPLYWMVLSAFKPESELQSSDPRPWTTAPTLDGFHRVLTVDGLGGYFLNSLLVAGAVVLLSLLMSFLAAVALTRFRIKGRAVLLLVLLVAQMVPVEALTIPLFFPIGGSVGFNVAVGDLDGDGYGDLAISFERGGSPDVSALRSCG